MKLKFAGLLLVITLFHSTAFAHSVGTLRCTGVASIAFDIGLSDSSSNSMKLGIPDLGVELLFCTEKALAGDYVPVWIGGRFGYKESQAVKKDGNITVAHEMRDFEISFISATPINTKTELGFGPKLVLSSPSDSGGVSQFAVQASAHIAMLPWREAKPENNGILGGVYIELGSAYGVEMLNSDPHPRYDVDAKLGYRFGGT